MSISSQEYAPPLVFRVGRARRVKIYLSIITGVALLAPLAHPFMLLGWVFVLHGLFRHWPGSPGAIVGGVINHNHRLRMRRGDGKWISGQVVDRVVLSWLIILSTRSGWHRSGLLIMPEGSGQESHRRLRRCLLR